MTAVCEKFDAIEQDLESMRHKDFDGNFADDVLDVVGEIRESYKALQADMDNTLYRLQKADADLMLEGKTVTKKQREQIYEDIRNMDASHDFDFIDVLIDEELKEKK